MNEFSARLVTTAEMTAPSLVQLERGTAVIFSAPSPDRTHDVNEDALGLFTVGETLVLAVADGLGGVPGSKHASRTALETFEQTLRTGTEQGKGPLESIMGGFEQANAAVIAGAGETTMVVAELSDRKLRTYNVGDSAALVVGQRGRLKLQTLAHSPVGYGVAAGLIPEDEAIHHEQRHYVSNTIGSASMRIEVSAEVSLAHYDTLVLASDGLFDNLTPEEIAEIIRKGPLEEASAGLIAACTSRMLQSGGEHPSKPDDLSFILYRPER